MGSGGIGGIWAVKNERAVGGLDDGAGGGCDSDKIWIAAVCRAVDSIASREEGVEALDESWVAVEEV